MRVCQELKIALGSLELSAFMSSLNLFIQVSDDWDKETNFTDKQSIIDLKGVEAFYYRVKKESHLPDAVLSLHVKDKKRAYVAHITPPDQEELSIFDYNEIINSFYNQTARPACAKMKIECELTPGTIDYLRKIDSDLAIKLGSFCLLADKECDSMPASDLERWLEVIMTAHVRDQDLNLELLKRYFTDEENWPPERASDLVADFGFGRALLKFYDRHRVL